MSVLMSRSFFLLDGRLLRAADRKKEGAKNSGSLCSRCYRLLVSGIIPVRGS